MLSFVFTDVNNKSFTVTDVISLDINMDEDIPADDMCAVFAYFDSDELKSVRIYDHNTVVFTGVIDVTNHLWDSKGEYIKVTARSMASMLLDNESIPISYNQPSLGVVALRHITPYCVSVDTDISDTYFGVMTVNKGLSNWQAVEDFSKNVFSQLPRVNEHGELVFSGVKKDRTVVFSNDGDGVSYSGFCENIRRCEEISKVRVKLRNSSGYNSVVENDDAVKRGIVRERYVNAVLTDTPTSCAEKLITNCAKKAYSVTLSCMGRHLDTFGCDAVIRGVFNTDRSICDLYVSSLKYTMDKNTDVTVLTLRRKDV